MHFAIYTGDIQKEKILFIRENFLFIFSENRKMLQCNETAQSFLYRSPNENAVKVISFRLVPTFIV